MSVLDNVYEYIGSKEPPKREDRLNAVNALGTNTCGLCSKRESGCLKNASRSFMQTQGCQLYLASSIINTIIDAVVVVHGPLGCAGANILAAGVTRVVQRQRDPSARGLIWLNTNLDQSDVVFGGEKKLEEAIRFADKEFHPQAILVASTCVPGIIGDDVDNVVETINEEVGATVVAMHCEGFKSKIMATAYDSVYHGILRALLGRRYDEEPDPIVPDEKYDLLEKFRISRTVNVFNVSSMSRPDELELTRLLNAIGLAVNLFPCYSHPDDFPNIDEAGLNVSICSTHDDYFGGHLKAIYGTPYFNNDIPIGTKAIRAWVLKIADFFGLADDAEKFLDAEEKKLSDALAPYRKSLAGKRVYLAGGEIRALAMMQFLQDDLGVSVEAVQGYHYDEFADGLLDTLGDDVNRKFYAATGQPFEQANILARI
jgi:nitrogenase molybdenum-iron protein alpha chain